MSNHHVADMRRIDDGWRVYCPECGRHIVFRHGGMVVLATGDNSVRHVASAGGVQVTDVDAHEHVELDSDVWPWEANRD